MNLLSAIALVMLTLVGYASGMTLVGREKEIQPIFIDLLLVAALWIGAFYFREAIGDWLSLFVWLAIALVVAAGLTAVRSQNAPRIPPKSELPAHARAQAAFTRPNPFRRAWRAWTHFAADMGNVQGRLLMGFFYFLVVTPFGLSVRLFSDPLAVKHAPAESGWTVKESSEATLEAAQEQG